MVALRVVSNSVELNWFSKTTRLFENMKDKLKQTIESIGQRSSFSDLEKMVAEMGREVLRSLLEESVNKGIDKIVLPCNIEDNNENIREIERKRCRKIKTQFGEISFSRASAPASHETESPIFPAENVLGIPKDTVSFGLKKMVAEEAIGCSMDRLIPKIERQTGEKVSKGKIIKILESSAKDFDDFYKNREVNDRENQEGKDFIVASFDGKGVPLRRKLEKSQLTNNTSALERSVLKSHSGKKKMATVASVHDSTFFSRTPIELHKTLLGEIRGVSKVRPRPIEKRVWASLKKPASSVIFEGFEEVKRRDPSNEKTLVVVIDGAEYQKKRVLEECRKSGRKCEIVIDIVHAVEYLWKAARALIPNDKDYQSEWVREKQLKLLEGGAMGIAKGMKARASKAGIDGERLKIIQTAAGYLSKNWKYMRYQVFLEKGYPVGSGVIEGACRSLIGDRLEVTGAHWSIDGAESVLKLRALELNGDFQAYWDHHITQELARRNKEELSKKSQQELIGLDTI